jgi:N-acetylglutamate synthase-like GNAT family acetyltransferase
VRIPASISSIIFLIREMGFLAEPKHSDPIMTKIRSAKTSDAGKIADLLAQLGYVASPTLVVSKITVLASSPNDVVLVAENEGIIVGVISLHVTELFHAPGRIGRITALVIASDRRGEGVGKLLTEAADAFFRSTGCVRAEVTSGDHRSEAHAFYQAQGYMPDERRFIKRYC